MERKEFQAETKKLLYIVANSLYKDKDVFVRELLSNASDALEKARYESLRKSYSGEDSAKDIPMEIYIQLNGEKNQIIIQDTGIGMNREDLIENLGTIARSGSQKFLENIKKNPGNLSLFL